MVMNGLSAASHGPWGPERREGDPRSPQPGKSLGDIFISASRLATQPGFWCHSRGWSGLQKQANDLELTSPSPTTGT